MPCMAATPNCELGLQLGFFGIVGIPLFKAMTEVFKEARPMLDGMLANYKHWEATSAGAPHGV